jgi:hypothetical protein
LRRGRHRIWGRAASGEGILRHRVRLAMALVAAAAFARRADTRVGGGLALPSWLLLAGHPRGASPKSERRLRRRKASPSAACPGVSRRWPRPTRTARVRLVEAAAGAIRGSSAAIVPAGTTTGSAAPFGGRGFCRGCRVAAAGTGCLRPNRAVASPWRAGIGRWGGGCGGVVARGR